MTTGRGILEDAEETAGASRSAWDDVRADGDIQFEPLPAKEIEPPPAWLEALGEVLSAIFGPVASALASSWPVLKWVLLAAAAAMLALIVWRLVSPYLAQPSQSGAEEDQWTPQREEALALLEEADRLAEAGDFSAAVHLLLARSVGQIAAAKPGLVEPSSTARELASQPSLPENARAAFAVIAARVERNLFALRDLGAQDWQQARSAYADFALEAL
ncbi:hypothetical protein OAS19_02825 [Altererythrobacter sp.]|nr:hypothetical protein [Altererythrobacter sp.]